jgi:hypothetical protein
MLWIAWNRNTPPNRKAADRKVVESAPHEAYDFVSSGIGLNEFGVSFIMIKKALLECGKFEKVTLLSNAFKRTLMDLTDWNSVRTWYCFVFTQKAVLAGAIPPFIWAFIN